MSQELQRYQQAIEGVRADFQRISQGLVNYDKESVFAAQQLAKTDWAKQVASRNPDSVRLAMINVASTGLTLNPANAYAYLVPRDGAIVLEISYKGLIKIACDTGSIEWARADVVFDQDTFTYYGPAQIPVHNANPFSEERGKLIGCYCVAKTANGDILCEVMPLSEIEKIRGKSDLYAKKKSGPWIEWFEQMVKKAVIKRASKTWPYTEKSDRIAQAIAIANASEGGYDLENKEEKAHRRKQEHDAACWRWRHTIDYIKEEINKDDPDLHGIREAWDEVGQACQEDQIAIWLAPTKGGVFTTSEREKLKNVPRINSEDNA